jgi:GNAT superfamily N-acetyltransferase
VRLAGPGEWAPLRQVRLAALADAPEAFASTLAQEAAFDEAEWRRRAATSPWFIAWRRGVPEGLAAAYAGRGSGAGPAGWQLVSMWVSPGLRGTGAADLLVQAVTAHARQVGATVLTLWVADGNSRARRFYQRLGFRLTGARQRYQRADGTVLDEAELALTLAGGASQDSP